MALAAGAIAHAQAPAANPNVVRVVLVGDSTLATNSGYGNALCGLFKWQVECVNFGRNGRSTRSYRADGSWAGVSGLLKGPTVAKATYVLIQFGHNDQPGRAGRSTDLATEFPANLARYVEEVREAGAKPILLTPLTRRMFTADGTLKEDLADWAAATRRVAKDQGVPLLDLNADSAAAVKRIGPAEAETLARPAGQGFDYTHVGPKGAAFFARIVASEIAITVPELTRELVVGAVEGPGRAERPQLTPERAKSFAYGEVLGPWDPLASRIADGPPPAPDIVVDRSEASREGSKAVASVQAAVNEAMSRAWGSGNRERVYILVRPGTYEERVDIPASAPPITLYGETADAQRTTIRSDLSAAVAGNTPASAIVRVRSRGFHAKNLTFENSYNRTQGDITNHSQAVALMLDDADEAHFDNMRFIGYQDTLYLASSSHERPSRAFFHGSYVEGDMDFIFGEATAYFLASEIRTLGDRAVSYALAPSTHVKSRHGFVFERCRFTHDGTPNALAGAFKLARQWNRSPEHVGKVAILNSSIGAHIDPVRPWADWSIGTPRHRPVNYEHLFEFNNTGARQ